MPSAAKKIAVLVRGLSADWPQLEAGKSPTRRTRTMVLRKHLFMFLLLSSD
jgi:hypothetical protein